MAEHDVAIPTLAPGQRIQVLWTIERGSDEKAAETAGAPDEAASAPPPGGAPSSVAASPESAAASPGAGRAAVSPGADSATASPGTGRAAASPSASSGATLDGDGMEDDDDEDDDFEQRWWGASVSCASSAPSYTILYDAYSEFAPSSAEVCLAGPRFLRDGGARMQWRPEEAGTEVVATDFAIGDDGMVDIGALARSEEGDGAAAMEEFGKLPFVQQSAMARSFRAFADGFKQELNSIVAGKEPGGVVTGEDVQAATAAWKAKIG